MLERALSMESCHLQDYGKTVLVSSVHISTIEIAQSGNYDLAFALIYVKPFITRPSTTIRHFSAAIIRMWIISRFLEQAS